MRFLQACIRMIRFEASCKVDRRRRINDQSATVVIARKDKLPKT